MLSSRNSTLKKAARTAKVLGFLALVHLVASYFLLLVDRPSDSSCWTRRTFYTDGYTYRSTCGTDFWPALWSRFTSFDVDELAEYLVMHIIGFLVAVVMVSVLSLIVDYIVEGWDTPSPVVTASPETPVCPMHDDETVAYCDKPDCPCPEHRSEVLATVWIPEYAALPTSETPAE